MKVYTLNFWLLCMSSFLFFASFNVVIPELPDFMRTFGAGEYVGLHITFFTLAALISRPFSGKLADTWGRIPVMLFGVAVTASVTLFYPLFANAFIFLVVRFLHGFSTGFKPSGTAAYVSDIIPSKKRGEGLGILGFFGISGMGMGNYIGGWIALNYPTDYLFYTSAIIALLSMTVLITLKETLPANQKFSWKLLKIKKSEIYEPAVIPPAIATLLVTFSFGVTLSIAPDHSSHLGIENKGLFFFYFTASSLVFRILGGKWSDKIGQILLARCSVLIVCLSALLIGIAENHFYYFLGAMIYGAGHGMSASSLFAWVAHLSPPQHRGRSFATMFMALELGVGSGAWFAGSMFQANENEFFIIFLGASITALSSFFYLLTKRT